MTRRVRWILAGAVAAAGAAVSLAALERRASAGRATPGDGRPEAESPSRVVPPGLRIKVEVFNATDTRGLALRATAYLRDAGFDVVYFGNTSERRDSSVVRDRTGHPEWSALAQRVMAPAAVEASPDSTRLVDLSVFVGSLWRPPADPLRP